MRKILFVLISLLFSFSLVGCDINLVPSDNETNNETNLTQEKINSIFDVYKNYDYITITEETTAIDSNNQEFKSKRITNADCKNNYYYSKISSDKIDGIIYNIDNSFYYKLSNNSGKLNYVETNDVYKTVGFSSLFGLTNYRIERNIAKINISAPTISSFDMMFVNTNLDLGTDYKYNPSILRVEIVFGENTIDSINFDLSLVFGSFYKSVSRKVTFSFEEFEKIEINNINDDYLVNTGNTLDTYVIEMVYEYGDSIYVKSGDFDMLIDAGQTQDGKNVNEVLKNNCLDKELDLLIATHGHGDHIGGFGGGALDSIDNIKLIIDYGYNDYSAYENLKDKYISKGADYYSAYDCVNLKNNASKVYTFSSDLSVEIINTDQYLKSGEDIPSDGNENDYSVVCKLTFKNNTYLFTGDISGDNFSSAFKEEGLENITVYKAAHHGANSYNSNNRDILNYLNPEICVSSGAIVDQYYPYDHTVNQELIFQHPRPQFVRWILNTPKILNNKKYYYNGTMGTIHISDNGIDIPAVNGLGAKRGYYIDGVKITGEDNLPFIETRMYKEYYAR